MVTIFTHAKGMYMRAMALACDAAATSTQQLQRMAGAGGPAAAARGFGLPVLGGRVVELMRFFFKKIFLAIMQEPLPHPKKLTHLASSIIP